MSTLLSLLLVLAVSVWWCLPAWRETYVCAKELKRLRVLLAAAKSYQDIDELIRLRGELFDRMRRPLPARWGFTL